VCGDKLLEKGSVADPDHFDPDPDSVLEFIRILPYFFKKDQAA